jgi:hypothetical protein
MSAPVAATFREIELAIHPNRLVMTVTRTSLNPSQRLAEAKRGFGPIKARLRQTSTT